MNKKTRDARYARRKHKRDIKRQEKYNRYTNDKLVENFLSFSDFMHAAHEASKGLMWKNKTIKFMLNSHLNVYKLREEVLSNKYEIHQMYNFIINERGKERNITSYDFSDKVFFKTLNEILKDVVHDYTISTNCASIKGRGYHYAIEELKKDLREHYRKHGTNGYIIRGDFKSYFDSIPHDKLLEQVTELYGNCDFTKCITRIIDNETKTGLSLGCELNQILAVQYPRKLDSFVQCQCHIKGYGRYMDDFYVMCDTFEEACNILELISYKVEELGLTLNIEKTKIIRISDTFTYLKNRIILTKTGKVLIKINKSSIKRMKKKIRKFRKMLDDGRLTFDDIKRSFISWKGFASKKDCTGLVNDVIFYLIKYFTDEILKDIESYKADYIL